MKGLDRLNWRSRTTKRAAATQALKKILTEKITPEAVIAEVKKSALRGRGGAGFPTGLKWSFMPQQLPGRRSTWSAIPTRASRAPSRTATSCATTRTCVIEGMASRPTRWASRSATTTSTARSGRSTSASRRRCEEARAAGYLGNNILGSDFSFELYAHHGYGAYICGEETGAARIARGQEGPAALQAAVPGELRPVRQAHHDQQHRDLRRGALDHPQRRRGVPRAGQAQQRRHQDLLGLRPRRAARQLRGEARHAVREAARDGGRHARRAAS